MKPREVLAMCREKEVKAIDLRFVDFLGVWQHFTIPVGKLEEDVFEDGLGFDGSSIRGWQAINESDMLLVPVPDTAVVDPFTTIPTLSMICNVQDPMTREDYSRDPRNVARKAATYLKSTGIADTCFIGPEAEFFVFDDVRFDQNAHEGYFHIDSSEAEWNRGRKEGPNLGHKLRHKEGYFPCPPADQLMDLRNEMMQTMIQCGIDVEAQHHEVAVGIKSDTVVHAHRLGDVLRYSAQVFPKSSVRTAPTLHVTLGEAVVRLIEHDRNQRSVPEPGDIRPGAEVVDRDHAARHPRRLQTIRHLLRQSRRQARRQRRATQQCQATAPDPSEGKRAHVRIPPARRRHTRRRCRDTASAARSRAHPASRSCFDTAHSTGSDPTGAR